MDPGKSSQINANHTAKKELANDKQERFTLNSGGILRVPSCFGFLNSIDAPAHGFRGFLPPERARKELLRITVLSAKCRRFSKANPLEGVHGLMWRTKRICQCLFESFWITMTLRTQLLNASLCAKRAVRARHFAI
jgi:hypothetical protein